MDQVCEICTKYEICLIEDCAHTLGAYWDGRPTGTFAFGKVGCFSTPTYKHINSGEGGLVVTNDEEVISKAFLYSGSYMFYEKHISRPSLEVFERFKKIIPNFSLRMSNLQAAILRPQLKSLDLKCKRWNERYYVFEEKLKKIDHISVPKRSTKEQLVGSSIHHKRNTAESGNEIFEKM